MSRQQVKSDDNAVLVLGGKVRGVGLEYLPAFCLETGVKAH